MSGFRNPAKCLDFTVCAETVGGDKSTWVLKTNQSVRHFDIVWNEALHLKGKIFSLVYVADIEKKAGPIEYPLGLPVSK